MAGPNYSLPSWLQTDPQETGKLFVSGLQVGAQIGEARNKLAAQQQQFAVEAQQKQDQITASALKEAQELQVSKAYNDQQISLKQQQLKIADEKVGAEIQKAARQFQAQQAYQKGFLERKQAGMSEEDAARGSAFENLLGESSGRGSMLPSSLMRGGSQAAAPPIVGTTPSGAEYIWSPKTGGMNVTKRQSNGTIDPTQRFQMQQQSQLEREQRTDLRRKRDALQKLQEKEDESDLMSVPVTAKTPLGIVARQKAYQQRAAAIQTLDTQLQSALQGQQDWQGYQPVQRGQQSSGAAGGVFDFDPKSGSLIPRQSAATSQEHAPKKTDDELLDDILSQYPNTDEQTAPAAQQEQVSQPQAAAPTAQPVAVSQSPTPQAQAPAEQPLVVSKAPALGNDSYSAVKTTDARNLTKASLSQMSAQKLAQAAKAVGLDWEIYYDGGDKFRYNDHTRSEAPRSIKRSKLESVIRDAAEEKQLVLQ